MKSPFRSIRQKLFTEGKLVRYIGYAVGEIALIIIGIMIAFELNNWNEARKGLEELEEYIVQLREDVRTAIDYARTEEKITKNRARENYEIVDFLKRSEFSVEDLVRFEDHLRTLGRFHEPRLEIGLLGELLNGNTDVISREKTLYQQTLGVILSLRESIGIIGHVQERINLGQIELSEFYGKNLGDDSDLPILYDLDRLRESKEFIYKTQTMGTDTLVTSVRFNLIAEDLQGYLAILEDYE